MNRPDQKPCEGDACDPVGVACPLCLTCLVCAVHYRYDNARVCPCCGI